MPACWSRWAALRRKWNMKESTETLFAIFDRRLLQSTESSQASTVRIRILGTDTGILASDRSCGAVLRTTKMTNCHTAVSFYFESWILKSSRIPTIAVKILRYTSPASMLTTPAIRGRLISSITNFKSEYEFDPGSMSVIAWTEAGSCRTQWGMFELKRYIPTSFYTCHT